MKILVLRVLLFASVITAFADDEKNFSITTNQTAEVKQKLTAFENGEMNLKELTGNGDDCRELIGYYLLNTNNVSVKAKLPISRCFAASGKYQQAAELAAEYVKVYSNDWHGWKILGGANLFTEHYSSAIEALTNSATLGDEYSYAPLSLAALKTDRLDIVSNLVSHLLILKNDKIPSETNPLDIVTVLAAYAVKADQKNIFLKAVDGVSAKQILSRDDLAYVVKAGCKQFKGKDIDQLRHEIESASISKNSISNPAH